MSIRLFKMYVKVPILLLAMIEGSLLLFAPYLGGGHRLLRPRSGQHHADRRDLPDGGPVCRSRAGVHGGRGPVFHPATHGHGRAVRPDRGGRCQRGGALDAVLLLLSVAACRSQRARAHGASSRSSSCTGIRLLFERIVDEDLFKRRVLVYGAGTRARKPAGAAPALRHARLQDRGVHADRGRHGHRAAGPAASSGPADLFRWAVEHDIDEIVVAMDDRRRGFPCTNCSSAASPASRSWNCRASSSARPARCGSTC